MADRTLSPEAKARRIRENLADHETRRFLSNEQITWLEEYAELLGELPRLREVAQLGEQLARRVLKEYGGQS